MSDIVTLNVDEARKLAEDACKAAGAGEATTRSLVEATLSAELYGSQSVGFPHLVDYLVSFREGRLNKAPEVRIERPFPAFITADADTGIAQLGFDLAFGDLVATARKFGLAAFSQANSYASGELGYYVRRLAGEGLVAFAVTNANAFMVATPGGRPVFSTNPLAFAFPLGDGIAPLVIDQSSSATAYVNLMAAAAEGRSIPRGWAVDAEGRETEDASRALAGALLPFGGRKGANIALMVEMMAAGLSGGNWSMDAGDFISGDRSPGIGLTVIAMMPGPQEADRVSRARAHVARLKDLGVYVPGTTRQGPREAVTMPKTVFEKIRAIIASAA